MAELPISITYGILGICAAAVIAIIVYLSRIDKFAQGVSDTVDTMFIKSVLKLIITTDAYSDSSNIRLWEDIANVIANWNGMSLRPFTKVSLDKMFEIAEGSIYDTLYSVEYQCDMLNCLDNLKSNIEVKLPGDLALEDIEIYPGWFERTIRELVCKYK